MAISKLLDSWAAPAAADLSTNLHYFGAVDSAGKIALAGDGAVVVGTIIEAAVADASVTVQYLGIGKVIAAETIAIGARLASDADGKAVAAAAGDFEVGTAISGGDAGELVSFIFASGRRHA